MTGLTVCKIWALEHFSVLFLILDGFSMKRKQIIARTDHLTANPHYAALNTDLPTAVPSPFFILGFRFIGLQVEGSGCTVPGLRFKVLGLIFRISGLG